MIILTVIEKVIKYRSSHERCSIKKGFLKKSTIFTGKHLCESFFFRAPTCNFIQKRLWHMCFLENCAKYLIAPFLQNISGWLLLQIIVVTPNNRVSNSSLLELFIKIGVFKYFATFTRKYLWSLPFNIVADWRPTSLTKNLWYKGFIVNFTKWLSALFHRTPLDNYF